MPRIRSGIKILVTQGPKCLIKRLREDKKKKLFHQEFLESAKKYHVRTDEELERQRKTKFKRLFKFSIITPLYNTPEVFLVQLIDSLQKQTYINWELCLADGSDSKHSYVGEYCKRKALEDSRIIYRVLPQNLGISENTNACISFATGEYLGLLDHDDILHESALYEMASAIEKTDADFLYSDEVKFSNKIEEAVEFNFKPDFGKDELRAHNYICHFTVFSRSLLNCISEVYRKEFDGSQDHDMVLRLTEKAKRVVHIPQVLYYWRVHENSVSGNLDSKAYAVDAAIHAIEEQLRRCNEPGKVYSNLPYRTIYRIKYEIKGNPLITIIIHHISADVDIELLKEKLLLSVQYETIEFLYIYDTQLNENALGELFNNRSEKANGKYIVFLDAACMPISEGWLQELMMYAQRDDVFGVSAKVLYSNDTICYAGISLDNEAPQKIKFLCNGIQNKVQGYEAMLRHVRNITAIWQGCFMVEKDKIFTLGGFDMTTTSYVDVDISLRAIDKGYWNVWTCFAEFLYDNNRNVLDIKDEEAHAFAQKWNSRLMERDSFYHPCLKELGWL